MTDKKPKPPAPEETRPGAQKDDNIDDLGRKQDGRSWISPERPRLRSPRRTGALSS